MQDQGCLLVEDGNHGEYRPRPDEFGKGDTAFIRAADMDNGRVLFESADRISDNAVLRIRKGIGAGGDILFSHKGTVGKLALTPLNSPRFVCSPQTTFWRSLDENRLDRGFLYYFMQSRAFTEQWRARKGETDMADYVSLTAQRQLKIAVPPIREQRHAAEILAALDKKLARNLQISRVLESLTRALFCAWFVDFDPVVAKAAGRRPDGVSVEMTRRFPDRFGDSQLGPIPAGWQIGPLPTIVEINPKRALCPGEPAPYLDMHNVSTESALPVKWTVRRCGSGMKFKNGDTVVARITPCLENGKTAFVNSLRSAEVGWGSTEFIVLHSRDPYPDEYSYFLARTDEFRSHAIANMTGSSGRQRVPISCLQHYPVVIPPLDIARGFGQIAGANLDLMKAKFNENRCLNLLREALVPELLSGKRGIGEDEDFAAHAGI